MTAAPRRRMLRADRRDQLLDAAEVVFTEKGFGPASMEDVADEAGVTKPVLYDHFGSKDGLLATLVERSGEQLLAATEAAVQTASSEQALQQGLSAYFRFVDAHAGAWSLLVREVAPGTAASAAADRVRQRQVDNIAALVAAHLPDPDPTRADVYAHIVSGAAERLAAVRLAGTLLSPDAATALLMDVMWSGFAQLEAGVRWEPRP
jgi:AcrR family transcriptional regulator